MIQQLTATLQAILRELADKQDLPFRRSFMRRTRVIESMPYDAFARQALGWGAALRATNARPKLPCLLFGLEEETLVGAFLGAISIDLLPVIVRPLRRGETAAEAFSRLQETLRSPALVIHSQSTLDTTEIPSGFSAFHIDDLSPRVPTTWEPSIHREATSEDLAFLQLTSGTTSSAKLACISHAAILANVRAIAAASECGDSEQVVSWLPHHHDMGLVGCELFSLVNSFGLATMRPSDFVRHPEGWLELISQTKGTLSPAPVFAFEYAAEHANAARMEMVDLSSWRIAYVGAEPIRDAPMRKFYQRFSGNGFRSSTFRPCYGLAEATLAVTLTPTRDAPQCLVSEELSLSLGSRTAFTPQAKLSLGERHQAAYYSSGRPLPGMELAILSEDGQQLEDEYLGEVVVNGPNLFSGYWGETHVCAPLRTGDIGFLRDGELHVVDRKKGLVIHRGQNFSAAELEDQLSNILELPVVGVAIFNESMLGPEAVVAIVEARKSDLDACRKRFFHPGRHRELLSRVYFVPRHSIPLTSSGKKKHAECRRMLHDGKLKVIGTLQ